VGDAFVSWLLQYESIRFDPEPPALGRDAMKGLDP